MHRYTIHTHTPALCWYCMFLAGKKMKPFKKCEEAKKQQPKYNVQKVDKKEIVKKKTKKIPQNKWKTIKASYFIRFLKNEWIIIQFLMNEFAVKKY